MGAGRPFRGATALCRLWCLCPSSDLHELSRLSVPKQLSGNLIPSIPILLYNTDNTTVIAVGHLAPDVLEVRKFDNINITPTRTLVTISEVRVPGAVVTTHNRRALNTFGDAPFSLVCLRNHLRSYNPITSVPGTSLATVVSSLSDTTAVPLLPTDVGGDPNSSEGTGNLLASMDSTIEEPEVADSASGEESPRLMEVDENSRRFGAETLGIDTEEGVCDWETSIRSRVLKDLFHVFNMLRLSTMHALRKEFARALRDVLLVPDQEDRMRISAWGAAQNPPLTFEQLLFTKPAWVLRRCRRIIPPPEELYPLVKKLFYAYGPLKDAKTQLPLFNAQNWKTAKQILELIRQGFVSDAPGIPLYSVLGLDHKSGNLPIYRCSRGTNFTEGGVHTHLRSRLPTSGASIRHVNACLRDFVLQHNLRVCHFSACIW